MKIFTMQTALLAWITAGSDENEPTDFDILAHKKEPTEEDSKAILATM